MKFESRCVKCNELSPIDLEKSNDNWIVYKTKCEKCGGNTQVIPVTK
ncbi:hypothetical protein ABEP17_18385 [Priestia flexa]